MRKKHKKYFNWWWISVPLVLIIAATTWLMVTAEEPPVKEIEEARLVLSEAEQLGAEIYSRNLYKEARTLYDSAMLAWKKENERFFVFRKFKPVTELTVRAKQQGVLAIKKTKEVRRNSEADLKAEIEQLRKEMGGFEKIFAALPLEKGVKDKHAKGKLLLNAAEIAFEKGEYKDGQEKSHLAAQLIRDSYRDARKKLDAYFIHLPRWQEELKDAVEHSRKHRTSLIVVEKIPGRCELYRNGEKKYSFEAEFGRNWIGDKQCEGDYATPEGEYKVVKKLQGGSTKYYKALLINYPNKEDRRRFEQLKKNGVIPRKAGIGSLIEIHGHGGRGANWTNGCVALSDKNMDQLYRNVDNGTAILIIGASASLDDVLKKNDE